MRKNNWLEDFFKSGFYENYWGWQLEDDDPEKMAADALRLLNASGSGQILDWCGGWGRVSIHFAKLGYQVTILDFMENYLAKADALFKANKLSVNTITADCRETPSEIQADYAVCFFNTVGFLSDIEQVKAFKSLSAALKPNGRIILDCMNLFYLVNLIKPVRETKREDGTIFRQTNQFNFHDNTMHSYFEIINPGGITEAKKEFYQRLYTPLDLKTLLEQAGFKVNHMYGDFNGEEVSFTTPKLIVVAGKQS